MLFTLLWVGGLPAQFGAAAVWQRMPDMPVGVFNAAASRVGDRAIVTGGMDHRGRTIRHVQVFDLTLRRWKTTAMLPEGRCLHAQVSLPDGHILIAGGRSGPSPKQQQSLGSALRLEPISGRMETLPPLPSAAPEPTAHPLADGRAIVIGGHHASVFDPQTNRWASHIDLRRSRRAHGSVVVDNDRVLVAGGSGRASLELIDIGLARSRLLDVRLPDAIDDLALVVLDGGRVLILGGQIGSSGDTTERTWVLELSGEGAAALRPGPRLGVKGGVADHCVVVQGHRAYVFGGETQQAGRDRELAEARLVDLHRLTVNRLPPMGQPHDDAVALSDGLSVIVFGGYRVKQRVLLLFAVPVASRTVERLAFDIGETPR